MTPSHLIAARLLNQSYWNATHINNRSGVQIYHQDIDRIRYIAIPGSNTLKDWLINLNFHNLITPFESKGYSGKVKLHSGFYHAYLSVRDYILNLAKADQYIAIACHSNGAIGQIAGVDINYNLDKRVEVISFGCPAIGNKAWHESANNRIYHTNYVNFGDIVPYLLPWNYHITKPVGNFNLYLDPHNIKSYVHTLRSLVNCYS